VVIPGNYRFHNDKRELGSSVSIVTRVWAGQLENQGLIPGSGRDISLHCVQTSSPGLLSNGQWGFFLDS
jgi:hypothetical protein